MPKKNGSPTKKEKWAAYKHEREQSALTIFKPSAGITSLDAVVKKQKEKEAKLKAEQLAKKNKKKIKKIHHTELLTKKAAATILNKPVNSFGQLPYLPNYKYTIPRPYKKQQVEVVKQLLDQLTINPQTVKKAVVYTQIYNYDDNRKDDYTIQQIKNYDYCMENQYLVVANIADSTAERDNVLPGLQSIIKMAAASEFDFLVMEHHNRLRCTNPRAVIEQMRNMLPIQIVFSGYTEFIQSERQKTKRKNPTKKEKEELARLFFRPIPEIINLDAVKLRKFRYQAKENKKKKKPVKKPTKKKTTTTPERIRMSKNLMTKQDAAKFINVPLYSFGQTPYIPVIMQRLQKKYREIDVRRVKPIIDQYIRAPQSIKKAIIYTQLFNLDINKDDYLRQLFKNYDYCLTNQYLVVGHFADYTEEIDNKLPSLQSIIKLAAAGEFDFLVMEDHYRVRCSNHLAVIEQMKNTLPIQIVFSGKADWPAF